MQFILFVLTAFTLAFAPLQQDDREFVWQRVDTAVNVRADGTLGVSETFTLRYTGGPYTFAYRDIALRRLDGINNIRVSDSQGNFQQVQDTESEQPRTFSVDYNSDDVRVRWVYPPTSDTSRTFTITYDVAGAIRRYGSYDEIWWPIVFADREEAVEQATGVIRLPSAVPADQITAEAPDVAPTGQIAITPGQVSISGTNIPDGQELTLRMSFPTGVVGGAPPNWQTGQEAQEQYNATTRPTVNVALSLLTALLTLGLGGWSWLWARRHRGPQASFSGPVYDPPSNLSPAEAGELLGKHANTSIVATLFDLANRGYLVFNERLGGWNNKQPKVFAVRGKQSVGELAPFEQLTIDALFDNGRHDEVELDKHNKAVTDALPKIQKALDQSLEARGLIDTEGTKQRKSGQVIATILVVLGVIALFLGLLFASRYSFWLPAVGGSIIIGGIAWFFAAASVRGLTKAGAEESAHWQAFQSYLGQFSNQNAPQGQFPLLLPYAVALSDAKRLTERYATTSEPLPYWFYPVVMGQHNRSSAAVSTSGSDGSGTGIAGASSLMLHDFSQNFVSFLDNGSGFLGSSSSTGATSSGGGGASGGGGGGAG